nr:premnaspirodiene oxygenase-like [Ipomoea batatas]
MPITLDIIKAIILDLFVAGTETSSAVVVWAMSEMMKNRRVLAKAQAEVRECMEETMICGYTIPVKARVLINVWAIGRDPQYWEDPDQRALYPRDLRRIHQLTLWETILNFCLLVLPIPYLL